MKVAAWFLLAVLLASPLSAATPEEFDSVVDFSTTLKDLSQQVQSDGGASVDPNRYLILEGTVASIMIADPNPDSYVAVVELVRGEWIGLEQINLFRVYVIMEGPTFAERLPLRMPRDPGPEIITTNSKLMVIGQFQGVDEGAGGEAVPVVRAAFVR